MASIENKIRRLLAPDTIGPPECPLLYRWTLFPPGFGSNSSSTRHARKVPDWLPKLLLHHFVSQADERHFHDHPRSFWTLVLRGGYDDLVPCSGECVQGEVIGGGVDYGPSEMPLTYSTVEKCPVCGGTGGELGDRMRAGTLRFRPAQHAHRTQVHPGGAWTLVLMGPWQREWGFWVGDQLVEWRDYFKRFGYGMRCV